MKKFYRLCEREENTFPPPLVSYSKLILDHLPFLRVVHYDESNVSDPMYSSSLLVHPNVSKISSHAAFPFAITNSIRVSPRIS